MVQFHIINQGHKMLRDLYSFPHLGSREALKQEVGTAKGEMYKGVIQHEETCIKRHEVTMYKNNMMRPWIKGMYN